MFGRKEDPIHFPLPAVFVWYGMAWLTWYQGKIPVTNNHLRQEKTKTQHDLLCVCVVYTCDTSVNTIA